jgi:monothiol glutaredoxin
MNTTTLDTIKTQIDENPVILYMKGSPKSPQCGFSSQACQALAACGVAFAFIDILAHPDIRETLPKFANWPTFPQLYINRELVGGCDIILELYQSGELKQMLAEVSK